MTSEGEMKEKLWSCTFWYESDYVALLVFLFFLIDPVLDTWMDGMDWEANRLYFTLRCWVFCISILLFLIIVHGEIGENRITKLLCPQEQY